MKRIDFSSSYRNPKFILGIILAVFFLKGVFLAASFPIFSGQDEARHYNSIQLAAEPNGKPASTDAMQLPEKDKDDFGTYAFSQEIQKTAEAVDTAILRESLYNTIVFSREKAAQKENSINNAGWSKLNSYDKPDAVKGSLYHQEMSWVEKFFADQNIFVRFYLIRILSVLLGTSFIFLSFLTARTAGFSTKNSLLLAAIVSFQPKLSMYFTNINYDALLLPMFALFTFAGVWTLRDGLNWKNLALLLSSAYIAYLTKGTGVLLLIILMLLLAFLFHEKIINKSKDIRYAFYASSLIIALLLLTYIKRFMPLAQRSTSEALASLGDYLSETLTLGRFALSSRTYWGTLSWVNSYFMDYVTNLIWFIQLIAIAGLVLFFFSKKKPGFLPGKRFAIFFLAMIAALQIGIRAYDWKMLEQSGSLILGTPGRYFLPNLTAHLILVFTGLGMILSYFKRENHFENILKIALILMFSFSMYLIFNVVIFRYYL